jgi:putative ABC transport system permease protein
VNVVRTSNKPAQISAALPIGLTFSGLYPMVASFQALIDQRFDAVWKMIRVTASSVAVATLLALIGIFGLVAFTVAQRTREIGVRMALSARGRDILRIVLSQKMLPFGAGAFAGILLAAASATVMRRLVYGLLPFEVLSFAPGLLLFAAVALAASIAPARRALRIDPSSALRYE